MVESYGLMDGKIKNIRKKDSYGLPYLLLFAQAVGGDPQSYVNYMKKNPIDAFFCLDALKFRRYGYKYCKEVIESMLANRSLRLEHFLLTANLLRYLPANEAVQLWDKIWDVVPDDYRNIHDEKEREYWRRFHMALSQIAPRPVTRKLYEKSKKEGKLVSFFKSRQTRDNGWLLYRYHPDIAESLMNEGLQSNEIFYNSPYLYWSVQMAFKHAEIYDGFMPRYDEMRSKVKRQAFGSKNPVKKANALNMFVARKEDVSRLKELVRDHSKVKYSKIHWPPDKKKEDYVVAREALHTLDDLRIDERSRVLRQIALDDEVPEPIAKLANTMYERHEGEYAIKAEDKDSNSKGATGSKENVED